MVVLLGVISGTFLPVYVMPQIIQSISLVSPMRWELIITLMFYPGGGILSIYKEYVAVYILHFCNDLQH